jgi:PAS domain S-box-containing protein
MIDVEYNKLPVGIYMIQKGRFHHVDLGLTRMLGYSSPESLIGKSIWEVVHPDDRKRLRLNVREEDAQSLSERPIVRVFKNDKTLLWVQMVGATSVLHGRPVNKGFMIEITAFIKAEWYL